MPLILHDFEPLHWAVRLGSIYPGLQRPFALPPLKVGTGEG